MVSNNCFVLPQAFCAAALVEAHVQLRSFAGARTDQSSKLRISADGGLVEIDAGDLVGRQPEQLLLFPVPTAHNRSFNRAALSRGNEWSASGVSSRGE